MWLVHLTCLCVPAGPAGCERYDARGLLGNVTHFRSGIPGILHQTWETDMIPMQVRTAYPHTGEDRLSSHSYRVGSQVCPLIPTDGGVPDPDAGEVPQSSHRCGPLGPRSSCTHTHALLLSPNMQFAVSVSTLWRESALLFLFAQPRFSWDCLCPTVGQFHLRTHTHTHTHTQKHTHTHRHTNTRTHAHTHTRTHIHTHFTHPHTHTHTHTYTHTCAFLPPQLASSVPTWRRQHVLRPDFSPHTPHTHAHSHARTPFVCCLQLASSVSTWQREGALRLLFTTRPAASRFVRACFPESADMYDGYKTNVS